MQPDSDQAFQVLQGLWISHILSALAKLGVADRMGEPATSEELARACGAAHRSLTRLLRTAAAAGILTQDGENRFGHTPISLALRKDAVPSVHGIASFFSDPWHTRAWERLDECVRTGKPAVDLAFGVSFFEYLAQHTAESATFSQGMNDFSAMEGPAVADAYDYDRFGSICDIGGGHGGLLALLLNRAPRAKGVLFDRPEIAESATRHPALQPHRERVEFVDGDMFVEVPEGLELYVMKRILHDWPDQRCVELLRQCRRAVKPDGRLLVVEQVIRPGDPSAAARLMDLEMMVLLGGEEREESSFRRIFADAGWRLTQVIPTRSPMFLLEGSPD